MNSPATHSSPAQSVFELRTLGGLSLRAYGEPELASVLSQPKRAALLCRLAMAHGFVRRDLLLPLFWPESDDAHGRASLRQAIHFLRQALGESAILSRGDEEIRSNEQLIWCDASAFEQALAEGRLREAFALYRGDFLPGFFVNGAAELDQWIDAERDRLRRAAVSNAWALATERERASDGDTAVDFARAAIALAPTDDALLRRAMRLMERVGYASAALAAYETHVRRMRVDYESEPDEQLQRVAAEIRTRRHSTTCVDPPALIGSPARLPETRIGRRWRRWTQIAVPAAMLGGGAFYMRVKAPPLAIDPRREIVLADFVDHTSDPNLAVGITQALRIDLADSRYVHLAGNERIGAVLKRMGHTRTTNLNNELAREVAVREGLPAVLQGEVAELGSQYVVSTQLVTADSGRVLLSYRERARQPDDVISAVDRLSDRLRKHMGEKLHGVAGHQPLAAVTTNSLDALKAYSAAMLVGRQFAWNGRQDASSSGPEVAARLMARAIEFDSTFAAAYLSYGTYLYWTGQQARANEMLSRAFRLRSRLPEQERLRTEGVYYSFVRADLDNATARFHELLQLNPRSDAALRNLMILYAARKDYTRAVYYAEREWAMHGGAPPILYVPLMLSAGRVARADSFVRYYAPREKTAGIYNTHLIRLEQTREDYRAVDTLMDRYQVLAQRSPPRARADAMRLIGSYKIWRGAYADGIAALREALARDDPLTRLRLASELAQYDVFVLHDPAAARRRLDAALHANPITSVQIADRPYFEMAQAYAFARDYERAAMLLQDHQTTQVPLTSRDVRHAAVYATRALIEASKGHAPEAREILSAGERDIGCSPDAVWLRLGWAAVEDLVGKTDSIIAAWERFASVPTCFAVTTYDAAFASAMALAHAHERLAQLYDARGDVDRAVAHYRRLIEIWPHPDPILRARWMAAKRRLDQLVS